MEPLIIENVIKLGMAVLIGGIVGAEREFQDKAAGFRTIILITVGSTLFTIFSMSMDPGFTKTRIAANIVTGIGFLGAGAIIREHGRIAGLTTAATIWLSAALGMGIGAGELLFVSISTLATVIVLLIFPRIEERIDKIRESRNYRIVVTTGGTKNVVRIKQMLDECSLHLLEHHQTKMENTIAGTWRVIGSPRDHDRFVEQILQEKSVKEMNY